MIEDCYTDAHGTTYHQAFYECDDFGPLDAAKVGQVYGVCFHDGRIVLGFDGTSYVLLGGKPEAGETYEQTLAREVREESNMAVVAARPIGYVHVLEEDSYALRYVCMVEPLREFVQDPVGQVLALAEVPPEQFAEQLSWGKIGPELLRRSLDIIHILQSDHEKREPPMPLPMVTTPAEAYDLIDRILDDPRIGRLVESFRSDESGLVRLREHLAAVRGNLLPEERIQADLVLGAWASTQIKGDPPRSGTSARSDRIDWLKSAAAGRWDFRCMRERDFIPTTAELLPPDLAEVVYDIASDWGMRDPRPATGAFDAVIILGGLIRANVNRPASAAQLLRDGSVSYPLAIGLASARQMSAGERRLAAELGVPGDTEEATLTVGMARAFGGNPDGWRVATDSVLEQSSPDGTRVIMVAAPKREDGTRRNTGEAFEWLLQSGEVAADARLLCVTTPIYWIQNHTDLLTRMQRAGTAATLFTAGGTVAVEAEHLRQTYLSQHYLQEIKSTVDVLPRLLAWAEGAAT